MAFTDELFTRAQPIWDAQLAHPFVIGLGDGSLPEARFRNWICQDYLYLKDFARIFAWAVAKSDRLESMGWYAGVLHLTLNTEMALHREYANGFGIPAAELETTPLWPTTRAYVDFLLRTAADGDMADLTAVLLPCSWGYVYVAQHLAARSAGSKHRYTDWIVQYVSPEFVDAADWLKGETNRLADGLSAQKRERLLSLFETSSRYEWQFWEMCWHGERWPV
ncbi:MAG TPA: thiaminase II [Candidatus Baltobacteraceae bacterium]|nr:thiaminase II [Candidatus Baltobacteraceae bacterium]